jgi:hypothetical protein
MMSKFMKFAESQLVLLKQDVIDARAKVVELKAGNESAEKIAAAEYVEIDRFARWQAVSNLIYNFDTIEKFQIK